MPQNEDRSFSLTQSGESGFQPLLDAGRFGLLLRIAQRGAIGGVLQATFWIIPTGGVPHNSGRLFAAKRNMGIDGDPVKPGPDTRLSAKFGKAAIGRQERFLTQIFRIMVIARQIESQIKYLALVLADYTTKVREGLLCHRHRWFSYQTFYHHFDHLLSRERVKNG